jgi:hypothetical protein
MTIEEISTTLNKVLDRAGYKPVRVVIETNTSTGRDVSITFDGQSLLVHIFPVLIKKTSFDAVKAILFELGDFLLSQSDEHTKGIWEKRFVRVRPDQVNLFQGKLSSGEYPTFQAIVQSIERATDRLVAIHLSNGLLSNGQTVVSSRNLNVLQWGTTSEFATGQKPYSLIPLVSVYAPADVYQHFNAAFADCVLSDLSSVAETSVRTAYKSLIHKVTEIFRK